MSRMTAAALASAVLVSAACATGYAVVHPMSADYDCPCNDTETVAALMDLYNSASGPNWENSFNWATTASVCFWSGVSCNGTAAHQELSIDVSGNGLNGTIPTSLLSLSSLVAFNANENLGLALPALSK